MSDVQQNELKPICNEAVEAAKLIEECARHSLRHWSSTPNDWAIINRSLGAIIQSAITKAIKRAEISVSVDTKRLDHVLRLIRDLEINKLPVGNFYLPETREGIDATMARDDVDRRDSSGVREEA